MTSTTQEPGTVNVLHAQIMLFSGIIKQIDINKKITRKELSLYKELLQELYPYAQAIYLVFKELDTV